MRFAFVTDELPRAGVAGHLGVNHALISWLRGQGHEVEILLVRPRLRGPVERYDFGPVAGPGLATWRGRVFARSWRGLGAAFGRLALAGMPGWARGALKRRALSPAYGNVDTVLGAFVTIDQAAWCAERIVLLRPDAVLVDTIFRAALLRLPALRAFNSVLIAHDVFFRRHRALVSAGYTVHPAVLTRDMEADLLNLASTIAAIQPEEAALIRAMCPERRVCVAPMPAQPCPRVPGTVRLADRLVFVGSDSLPNLDGLRWFFADVWPRLKTWRGTLTLDLVGDCARAFPSLPEGVYRVGRVKSLAPALHRAALAIAPLRVGSGLKIKLLDYARHGLITVASPVSLQGFAADEAAPFIAAGDAVAFTVAIANQLRRTDPDERRAFDYVTRHYGIETSFAGLARALNLPDQVNA